VILSNFLKYISCCDTCRIAARRISWSDIVDYFEQKECVLLSSEVERENQDSPLRFKCSCGGEGMTTWKKFRCGHRCKECLQHRRASNSRTSKRYTLPSGKIIIVDGAEPCALDELLEMGIKEEDIFTGDDCPIVYYNFNGERKRYFPDIFIPSKNILIEVKSTFTLNTQLVKNMAKFEAAGTMYNFFVWIYGDDYQKVDVLSFTSDENVKSLGNMNIGRVFKINADTTSVVKELNSGDTVVVSDYMKNVRAEGYKKFSESLAEYGYKMISPVEEYKNATCKLVIETPDGKQENRSYSNWKTYMVSTKETIQNKNKNKRYTYKTLCDFAESIGFKILNPEESFDAIHKLTVQCECVVCGKKESVRGPSFTARTSGCKDCMYNSRKLKWSNIVTTFESQGCKLISMEDEYNNNQTSLKFICSCGNISRTVLRKFKENGKCYTCIANQSHVPI
jgi:hypothetical protein